MDIPTIIELCAGYGGIGLGVGLAIGQTRPLVYVEREISAARILVARMQDGSVAPADIWSDLKTFDGAPYRGKTDILCAGYPCQPFSCAGKQLGKKDPRHLWPYVARIIREVQPRQVFLENVDAHLRLGFHEVASELESMGYRVACGLFSAEEVGAPHRRLRLFALAERTAGRRGKLRQSPGSDRFTDGRGAELAGQVRQSEHKCATELADHDAGRCRERANETKSQASGRCGTRVAPGGDSQLEDPARLPEHGRLGQDGGRGRRIRQTGDELADAGNGQLPVKGRGAQGRTGIGPAGAAVAHSGLSGSGRVAEPQEERRARASDDNRRTGRTVADARSTLQQARAGIRRNGQPLQGARSGNGSGSVADAKRPQRRPHLEQDELSQERLQAAADAGSRGTRRIDTERDGSVDDAARERYALWSDGQDQEAQFAASVRAGIPVFPPGPGDLAAWSRLLVQRPDVEPAVCRNAYERADRVHGRRASSRVSRLRALGNGVVPLVAAHAYLSLSEALAA